MKLKSFAMLAMSGFLAASFAYVAPAMAEDTNNIGESVQTMSSDNNQNNATSSQTDTSNSPTSSQTDTSNSQANSGDEGTPDTATGDDDY